MTKFRHEPSGDIIQSTTSAQTARYRRSHRFTELDPTDSDTDNHYQSPTDPLPVSSSSPQSPPDPQPIKPSPLESDRPKPPESPQIPTIAPDATEPVFDDLPLTDINNHTVSQVLAWVDNNPQRARQALHAETQGRNRVTLTAKLRRIT